MAEEQRAPKGYRPELFWNKMTYGELFENIDLVARAYIVLHKGSRGLGQMIEQKIQKNSKIMRKRIDRIYAPGNV